MFTFTRFGHKALASWTEDTYEDISELAKFPIPLCVSHDSSLRGGSSGHTQLGELGPVTSHLHPIFLMDAKCRRASPLFNTHLVAELKKRVTHRTHMLGIMPCL